MGREEAEGMMNLIFVLRIVDGFWGAARGMLRLGLDHEILSILIQLPRLLDGWKSRIGFDRSLGYQNP